MKKSVAVVCSLALSGVLVSGAVLARGVSEKKASIGSQSALDIALADAGVRSADARNTKSVFEREGVGYVYDVEFDCGTNEYDYIIDAKSGEILVRDIDSDDGTPTTTIPQTKTPTVATATDADGSSAYISVGQAKEIALAHAQLSASEVRFRKAVLERDDGFAEYEIEFIKDRTEYEYSVDAETGKILEHSIDRD